MIRKLVTLPREMLAEVAEYRFGNQVKSESEAFRQLIRAGLEATKKKRQPAG
ncbi:hypothetical protein M0638_25020 [Roseomonas sp. NAR14]|uniref:Uncharacterized protein n=1 Tax=Roseomonas acroporae TaxID=2937791 RepID=A0A9X2BWC2_9PROT|nr:hypothetical protein [Roseomonas acroporae]MCK8787633.1 hypothetical protein [Roseomonas acroporae]